jgi:hypothetical protein
VPVQIRRTICPATPATRGATAVAGAVPPLGGWCQTDFVGTCPARAVVGGQQR